jgi:hypothetical protein
MTSIRIGLGLLCLALSTHAEEVVRIAAGTIVERATIPCGIGQFSVGSTLPAELSAQGWRYYRPSNTANVKTQHWQDTGIIWTQIIDAVWSQAELDEQTAIAASNAAAADITRKTTPIIYDQPIEAPLLSLISQANGVGVGIVALDDGTLATFTVHASPWPNPTNLAAKIKAAVTKAKTDKDKAKEQMNGQLQTRLENLERLLGVRP